MAGDDGRRTSLLVDGDEIRVRVPGMTAEKRRRLVVLLREQADALIPAWAPTGISESARWGLGAS